MSHISRKQLLEQYRKADTEQKGIYQRLLQHDILNATTWLHTRLIHDYAPGASQPWIQQVENTIESEDFPQMLNLYYRLHHAAHSIKQLEAHLAKLNPQGGEND